MPLAYIKLIDRLNTSTPDIGGVTAAAGKLNLTQSAVSMQIKRLETLLGRRLVTRQGRGIELTVHGEQLLDYGRQILGINDEV